MFNNSLSFFLSFLSIISINLFSDSLKYNNFNNHGVVGLINMPSARFYDESSYGFTLINSEPDQKLTLTSSPFDWLEASFFYTNIDGRKYCDEEFDPICNQDYKDKGFNLKIRLKEEGILPALAIGFNDIAGTGLYSSEYIVASYGINNIDFHAGIGWGNLNGQKDFKNPLSYLDESFKNRPSNFASEGGQFQPERYYSDSSVSAFFGLSYVFNSKYILKIERDTTLTPGEINFKEAKIPLSIGLDYQLKENFNLGISFERGNTFSIKFNYKKSDPANPKITYKTVKKVQSQNKYDNLIASLEENGIGVNKIIGSNRRVGIEVTQFNHSSLQVLEEIISDAKAEASIDEEVLVNYKIAGLDVIKNFDFREIDNQKIFYTGKKARGLNTNTSFNIRPFIAGREGFLKVAALVENDSEYIFSDNFFFSSNLKYSIWDNFDELIYPPKDTYPAQVRSDVKNYLNNFNNNLILGRAQFDAYKTISENDHLMITFGILEEMFSGYGFEYLHFDPDTSHAYGFEVFNVQKRDYELGFGLLDYKETTGHFNYYYRNYGLVPFDLKASYGKYLAGDIGGTIELSRSFQNGVKFGIFATFTDVSSEQFGEGSFDKGIFFNIPIFKNAVSYTWRPLTKDPGAKLTRKNSLHDLLVKFSPIN